MSASARGGDRRIALLLGCCVSLFLVFFHRGHFEGTDELGVYETTRAIAAEGTVEVPAFRHTYRGRDGKRYSQYAIGQSLLALPFYELGRGVSRVVPWRWQQAMAGNPVSVGGRRFAGSVESFFVGLYAPVVAGLLVFCFFLFERQLGVSVRSALAAGFALGTCTYLATLSTFFLRHVTEALLILAALYHFHGFRRSGDVRRLAWGSLCASAIVLIRLPAAVAGLPLAAYLGFVLLERRDWSPRLALAIGMPFLAVAAAHLGLEFYKWGSIWGAPMVQAGRFSTPLALSGPAFLFSPGTSIFVYSPLLLLVPFALPAFWKTNRVEALAAVSLFVTFWLFFSLYEGWTGLWSAPGPRYLAATIPPLLLPLGGWLDAGRRRWLPVALLAALGLHVQMSFMATHWSGIITRMDYKSQEHEWSFLFSPVDSPPAAAARDLWSGAWHPWIVRLARGTPNQAARPGGAAALALMWAAGLAGCGAALGRASRPPAA